MKACPVPNCGIICKDDDFVCYSHWSRVPNSIKRMLSFAYHQHKNGDMDADEYLKINRETLARLGWLPTVGSDDTPCPPFAAMPKVQKCQTCGHNIVIAYILHYRPNEVGPTKTTVELDRHPDDLSDKHCVIGGAIYHSSHEFSRPCMTRFSIHKCQGHYDNAEKSNGVCPSVVDLGPGT